MLGEERLGRALLRGICGLTMTAALVLPAAAQADPVLGPDMSCVAPAGNPAPGTPEWQERDTLNQYCASLRNRDQVASPAFGFGNVTQGASLYAEQTTDQLADPSHPRGGITTLVPGSKAADPFRTLKRWTEQGRGRVEPVAFKSLDGATLRGHVFLPPESVKRPKGGYPGVVITDGSVQAYEELYFWAAEDLASNGYEVMTYDVQGQGDSDLFGDNCPDTSNPSAGCPGVPYQQNYNFYQGAEDSLSFFLSKPDSKFGGSSNPYFRDLNPDKVGIAGHSLGAAAVSVVGQCDKRVKTIVAWDDLDAITDCSGVTIPPQDRSATLLHAPALALTNDYLFNTEPMTSPPDPHAKDAGYQQLAKAGLDTQIVTFRGATHLTYTYIPLVFQASELNERMASYYTRAWFDLQLRHKRSGFTRLTATKYDDSADTDSIGAGVYDPSKADPTDPYAGNVPYTIAGVSVPDSV
ncbi:MAG: Alpha/beta hydrolase family protein, partial [Solirubrobacteraceae bacterium]|nr:Alpha/beta hydrolase family protein [Solirubrobacteraceae bacterium]